MTQYFAYGFNMDAAGLRQRIGATTLHWRRAWLDGYDLTFDKTAGGAAGYANIRPCDGARVHGVLYRLTEAQLRQLDDFEGVEKGHYRRRRIVVSTEEGPVEADVYIARESAVAPNLKPRREYLSHIIAGARQHRLPDDYVNRLARTETAD